MNQIYLDREQCEKFEVEYFESSSTTLRADVILASKFSGYDKVHTDFLQAFQSRDIMLMRNRSDAPGWYRIVPPQKLVDPVQDACPVCGVSREPGDPVHGGFRCDCWQR